MKLFFVATLAATVAALHVDQRGQNGRGAAVPKGKGPKGKGGKVGNGGKNGGKPKPGGKKGPKKGGKKVDCQIETVATYEPNQTSYQVDLWQYEVGCTAEGGDRKWYTVENDGNVVLDKRCKNPYRFEFPDGVWERIVAGLEEGGTPPDDAIAAAAEDAIAVDDQCDRGAANVR